MKILGRKLGINCYALHNMRRNEWPIHAIKACIQKYGSIEGLYLDRKKKIQLGMFYCYFLLLFVLYLFNIYQQFLAMIKENEKDLVRRGISERIQKFNKAIMELGYPELIREIHTNKGKTFEFISKDVYNAICIITGIAELYQYYQYDVLFTKVQKYIVSEKITLNHLLKCFPHGEFGYKTIQYFVQYKTPSMMIDYGYGYNFAYKGYFQKLVGYFFTKKHDDDVKWFGKKVNEDVWKTQIFAMLFPVYSFFHKSDYEFNESHFHKYHNLYSDKIIVMWSQDLSLPPQSFVLGGLQSFVLGGLILPDQNPPITLDIIKNTIISQYDGVNPVTPMHPSKIRIVKPSGMAYTELELSTEKIICGILISKLMLTLKS